MEKVLRVKVNYYTVHCYCGNHCYRTVLGCKKEDVKNLRKLAKLLGETIKVEFEEIRYYEFKI